MRKIAWNDPQIHKIEKNFWKKTHKKENLRSKGKGWEFDPQNKRRHMG
jgi:hypothetical protein